MNTLAALLIADSVRTRIEQGDCPTEPPHHRETVEEALCELQRMIAKDLVAAEYTALKRSHDTLTIDNSTLRAANEGLRDSYLAKLKENKALIAVLSEVREYFDQRADISDKSDEDGTPHPNVEMRMRDEIDAAIKALKP